MKIKTGAFALALTMVANVTLALDVTYNVTVQ
jgi:hypothetical protein